MALSTIGWVDGITASGVLLIGCILGLIFIYKSLKLEADVLLRIGLVTIFAGLAFLGVFVDFLIVLSTGHNIDNSTGIVGLLSYIWIAPFIIIAIYIGSELIFPEKKWYITIGFTILMIIFEVLIFLDPVGSFNFVPPKGGSGTALIDYNVKLTSPAGILMIIFIVSTILFLGVMTLFRAIQSTGDLRKKFLLLAIGMFLYAIFGFMESLTELGFLLIPVRIGYISGPIFMYFALKD